MKFNCGVENSVPCVMLNCKLSNLYMELGYTDLASTLIVVIVYVLVYLRKC